jgi:hypothetical protein
MPIVPCARPRALLVLAFGLLLSFPLPALAQRRDPIGPYAFDVRGIFARHKQQPSVATDLGVLPANIPTRSIGLLAGVHWYPVHAGQVALGIGGQLVVARGSRTLEPEATTGTTGTPGPTGTPATMPTVLRHFRSIAPEVSVNFGHRNGWSYVSGGLGRSQFFVERADRPVENAPGRKTIHYGAGARWFVNHHLAVSLDLRWYAVSEQPASATGGVAQPHTTFFVLSGGVALR